MKNTKQTVGEISVSAGIWSANSKNNIACASCDGLCVEYVAAESKHWCPECGYVRVYQVR